MMLDNNRELWVREAKCFQQRMEWSLFWPEIYDGRNARNKAARILCGGCPVIGQCADDALSAGDTGVIRAGVPIPDGGCEMRSTAALMYAVEFSRLPDAAELQEFIDTHHIPEWTNFHRAVSA
jgi:hypothetical protein